MKSKTLRKSNNIEAKKFSLSTELNLNLNMVSQQAGWGPVLGYGSFGTEPYRSFILILEKRVKALMSAEDFNTW